MGGLDHLLYVAGVVLLGALLVWRCEWVRERARPVRAAAFAVVLLQQAALYGFYAVTDWDWAESLPLHICRVSAVLAAVYLVTGKRAVADVEFAFGLWAWVSFAYPVRIQPIDHILGWSFFISHAAVVLLPVFAWIADGWRPIRAGLRTVVGWFVMYVTGAVAVNALTGGNYFYQRERPVLPWLDQPWYLLGSVAVSLLLFVVGHAGARWIGARVDGVTPPPAPEATGASRSRDDAGAARVGA